MATSIAEMKRIINILNNATEKYDAGNPYMSDIEWDNLYFKLKELEKKDGFVLDNSPTNKIHYVTVNQLEKVTHNHPMLSLDKTKNAQTVKNFLGEEDFICMGKMDGLTLSLHYIDGKLISAETRGNGVVGEQVLHNAMTIWNIPKTIKGMKGELIVDGEVICTYKDFEEFKNAYKNPRNFASGSIRLLDANECRKRKLTFVAWDVVKGFEYSTLLSDKLELLSELGFTIVPFISGNKSNKEKYPINEAAEHTFIKCEELSYPIDGLVFKFDNCEYYKKQGRTEHHFRGGIAFKRYDEETQTTILNIEWQLGRSGILTPVAIFEPVEILGTTVSRASLHNLSVMESLYAGTWFKGLQATVFKANEIIPQLSSVFENNDIKRGPSLSPPKKCPYCGYPTTKKNNEGIVTLYCTNVDCGKKMVAQIEHFCSTKGMDIKGLSGITLNKLYEMDWVNSIEDIFILDSHRKEWENLSGFGKKSVDRVLDSIERSKKCSLATFISALGIPLIGKSVAKEIVKKFPTYTLFRQAIEDKFNFSVLPNFATAKTNSLLNYDYSVADKVYNYLNIIYEEPEMEQEITQKSLSNIVVCITGKLTKMKREQFKQVIEERGGKVVDSVSKKVHCLISNDSNSGTVKIKKAKELGIEIISEEEFIKKFLE